MLLHIFVVIVDDVGDVVGGVHFVAAVIMILMVWYARCCRGECGNKLGHISNPIVDTGSLLFCHFIEIFSNSKRPPFFIFL